MSVTNNQFYPPVHVGSGLRALALCGALAAATLSPERADAVEGGAGFYILGSRTTMGGAVPPPGTYFMQQFYGFDGNSTTNVTGANGNLLLDFDASAFVSLSTVIWAPDMAPIMGGRPYFLAVLPVGNKSVSASGIVTGPGGGVLSGAVSDDNTVIGDPVLGGGLGWGAGPWFSSLNVLVNVPVGEYDASRVANVAFNRWATDITGALTWIDPASGWQADLALGVTFNGNNDDTDYHSGDEFHLEAAVMKTFANGLSAGLQGYYYEQINGDSGSGAVLGDFEGQVSAIGPAIAYTAEISGIPVSFEARFFHEFDARNRIPGDTFLFNVSFPLGL